MKTTITQYLHMEHGYDFQGSDYERKWRPIVMHYKGEDSEDRIFIRPINVDVEIPDDFDPTAKQIAAIERERAEATAAYLKTLHEINERLSNLQAIGNAVEA